MQDQEEVILARSFSNTGKKPKKKTRHVQPMKSFITKISNAIRLGLMHSNKECICLAQV